MQDKAPAAPNAAPPEFNFPDAQALMSDPETWRRIVEALGGFAVNLAAALAILAVTIWASGWASRFAVRLIGRLSKRRGVDPTLQNFFGSLARYLVVIIGAVAAMQQLGVKATSILAVLGAASLAIGLALQGTLSNVAAGVMLLLFRPYRVGEFVDIAGQSGTVRSLDLFTTTLNSVDNLRVSVPNGKVFGDVIVNYSRPSKRRMELHFGVDYADDLDKALALLLERAKADKRILKQPEPWAKVTALQDSSVQVTLRAWARPAEYWDARFDLVKDIKESFEAAGLSFPYPHQVAAPFRDEKPLVVAPVSRPRAPLQP